MAVYAYAYYNCITEGVRSWNHSSWVSSWQISLALVECLGSEMDFGFFETMLYQTELIIQWL